MDNRIIIMLQKLHDRPGVYIGRKSLERLTTFISGYIQCLYDIEGSCPDFLPGFQKYIEARYGLKDNIFIFRHWSEIISFFNATEDEAFDEFYELLKQYLNV